MQYHPVIMQTRGEYLPTPSSVPQSQAVADVICINNFKYPVGNYHGQTICGPPIEFHNYRPGGYYEVYVNHIPPLAETADIMSLFSRAGSVYVMRILKCFSGLNRGIVFVRYLEERDCRQAIEMFHRGQALPNGGHLIVKMSDNVRELVIGHIDITIPDSLILEFCRQYADYSKEHLAYSVRTNTKYIVLTFNRHAQAAFFRRVLLEHLYELGGRTTYVNWNKPNRRGSNEKQYEII